MIMIEVLLDRLICQRKKKIRLILIHLNSVFDGLFNNVQQKPLLIKGTFINLNLSGFTRQTAQFIEYKSIT